MRDVKYGARTLLRSPEFAIVSVLVMALGIGATTSLFTMVRAVLLRPLPFRDPGKLVMLYEHFRQNQGRRRIQCGCARRLSRLAQPDPRL